MANEENGPKVVVITKGRASGNKKVKDGELLHYTATALGATPPMLKQPAASAGGQLDKIIIRQLLSARNRERPLLTAFKRNK